MCGLSAMHASTHSISYAHLSHDCILSSHAGAGYLEMAAAVSQCMLQGASSAAVSLVGTSIAAPLILPTPAGAPADYKAVVLTAEVPVADGTCQLASGSAVHVTTRFAAVSGTAVAETAEAAAATERLMVQCSEPLATEYAYRQLAAAGLQYGPAFRLLRGIKRGGNAAAAAVRQPTAQQPAEFVMNPAVLDCCLQLGGMVPAQQGGSRQDGNTYIPAALAALYLGSGVARIGHQAALALAQRPDGTIDTADAVLRNHSILGAAGGLVCQLDGLESKSTGAKGRAAGAAGRAAAAATPDMLYEITWKAADAAAAQPVAASSGGWSLSLSSAGLPLAGASIAAVQGALVGAAASLQLQTHSGHATIALPTAASAASQVAGQMWGLVRTTAAECHGMAVGGTDCDALASAAGPAAQLVVGGNAATVAFDGYGSTAAGGSRFLPFMQPSAAQSSPAPFQLLPQPRGALQNLVPVPVQATSVPAGQALVAVKAVGINFR